MNRKKLIVILLLSVLYGCKERASIQDASAEMLDMSSAKVGTFSDFADRLFSGAECIAFTFDDKDAMFSSVDKVVCHSGCYYLMDGSLGKLVVADSNGKVISTIGRRGRGSDEFLQITDFDVDSDGSVWILDGRKDKLFHYSDVYSFMNSKKLPYEISHIKCLPDNRMLVELSSWDKSRYKGRQVIIVDAEFNVIGELLDYCLFDPDYELPSVGFSDCGETVLYHRPVDDMVYRIAYDGSLVQSYYFDFGPRTVPEQARKSIERYWKDYKNYTTLVQSVYIDENVAIGKLLDSGKYVDFIFDRQSDIVFLRDKTYENMHFLGYFGDKVMFLVPAGADIDDMALKDYFGMDNSENDLLIVINADM